MTAAALTAHDIKEAARAAGLAGRPVCLHSSLRSFGYVTGGADAVIEGFLAAGATLLVPTASASAFAAPSPAGHRPLPFNCEEDGSIPVLAKYPGTAFCVSSVSIDPEMGAIPAALLRQAGRSRGNHPLSSFAAHGPAADKLVRGQTADDVFAPLRALAARQGALVLTGVDLTAATIVHLAEEQAGLRLLVRWAYGQEGAVVPVRHGGCSRGFERLSAQLRSAQTSFPVGPGGWRVFDAAFMLRLATRALCADPSAATCENRACIRCAEQVRYARRGGVAPAARQLDTWRERRQG